MTLRELIERLQAQAAIGGCADAQVQLELADEWMDVGDIEYDLGYVIVKAAP